MLLGAQWYILFNVIAGASAIPRDLKEVSAVYRMADGNAGTRLYVPSVFPYRSRPDHPRGGAWNASIVSEFVQVKDKTSLPSDSVPRSAKRRRKVISICCAPRS